MRRSSFLLLLLLLGCSGGGGSSPPPPNRAGVYFGYFAQDATTVLENREHTNLIWTTGSLPDQMAAIQAAKGDGRKVVVQMSLCLLPLSEGRANASAWLGRLHDAGLLDDVVAVSWCDEPNTARAGAWGDAGANEMNLQVKEAMGAFPELHAALAGIFACKGDRPGISTLDWISCDDYDSGCGVFDAYLSHIPLLKGQKLFAVVAGDDPWRLDPKCARDAVEADPQYVALVAFTWQTVVDGANQYRGIRENGLERAYCLVGRDIIGRPGLC